MADLDVTELLVDPTFADQFTVLRRAEVVGSNGISTLSTRRLSMIAVVTIADQDDLERTPDQGATRRSLTIVTKFPLQATAPNCQPDLVFWEGDYFVVESLEPYTKFGPGFVEATALSIDYVDAAPDTIPPAPGQLDFYAPARSGLIGALPCN